MWIRWTGAPGAVPDATRTPSRLACDALLVVTSGAYLAVYLWIAVRRLPYPFDLEWMEGACVDHVARLMSGQKIYVQPSLTFIPFFYPPFYYSVAAAVSGVIGLGLLPLRLVSWLSSLVVFGLTYALVW